MKRIDDYTIEVSNKKDGKVTTVLRAVYAKDGKSRTETTTGTNAQGGAKVQGGTSGGTAVKGGASGNATTGAAPQEQKKQ